MNPTIFYKNKNILLKIHAFKTVLS